MDISKPSAVRPRILSLENQLLWSWGMAFDELSKRLKLKYDVVRIQRVFRKLFITYDLANYFDVILAQNVDAIKEIPCSRKHVIARMGGMLVDENNAINRYDAELASVGVVVATNKYLFDVAARVNHKCMLVPNGVNLQIFKPRETPRPDRPFTVGFSGNIWGGGMVYKGYDVIAQAFVDLSATGRFAQKVLLYEHNQIDHADMPSKFYHQIDCLINLSFGEGCSNVIGEALACGVPVVMTKVGYHGEFLRDNEECLFVERERKALVDKILMLEADKGLQEKLSTNGRRFAMMYQDIETVARQYDMAINLCLENKPKPPTEKRKVGNNFIRKLFKDRQFGTILNLGCGENVDKEGNCYDDYFKYEKIIHIDPVNRENVDITCKAEKLLLPSQSVDFIFCNWVLYKTQHRLALLEMMRVLKPGGEVFLSYEAPTYELLDIFKEAIQEHFSIINSFRNEFFNEDRGFIDKVDLIHARIK